MKKILVSARDPGAAQNIAPVARQLLQNKRFDVTLIASEPAFSILKKFNLSVDFVGLDSGTSAVSFNASILLGAAREVFKKIQPDTMLVGQSGPDVGIDEALLYIAPENFPSYVIQDYWGYLNNPFGKVASTYFVIDEEALQLSQNLYSLNCSVTGLPKYIKYHDFPIEDVFRNFHYSICGENLKKKIVGIFGQPLWQISGYEKSLNDFLGQASSLDVPLVFFYRPHPKEVRENLSKVKDMFVANGCEFFEGDAWSLEELLCGSDVVCSMFSTCGYDQIMMNRLSSVPLGAVLFLLFDKEVYQVHKEYTSIEYLPPSKKGYSETIYEKKEIKSALMRALSSQVQRETWGKIVQTVTLPDESVSKIVDTISRELEINKG